jgi:hypothetical protein
MPTLHVEQNCFGLDFLVPFCDTLPNFKLTYVSIAVDALTVGYIFNGLYAGGPNVIIHAGLSLDLRSDNVGEEGD